MELLKTYYDDNGKIILSPQDMSAREFYRDYIAVHRFNEMFVGCPQTVNLERVITANGFKERWGNTPGALRIGSSSDYDVMMSDGPFGTKVCQLVGSFVDGGDIFSNNYRETYNAVGKEIRLKGRIKSPTKPWRIDQYDENGYYLSSTYNPEEEFGMYLFSYDSQSNPYGCMAYLWVSNRGGVRAIIQNSASSGNSCDLSYGGFVFDIAIEALDGLWHAWELRLNLSTKLMSIVLDGTTVASSVYNESSFYNSDSWNGTNPWDPNDNYMGTYWTMTGDKKTISEIAFDSYELEII
jgi:hypothetical protein